MSVRHVNRYCAPIALGITPIHAKNSMLSRGTLMRPLYLTGATETPRDMCMSIQLGILGYTEVHLRGVEMYTVIESNKNVTKIAVTALTM